MEFNYEWQPGLEYKERNLVKNGKPEITIVTPFYNGAKYFEQTYNCVMNQTFPWFEWIIVNDGSTRQEDVELAERFAAQDPRVRVVHKENGGISTARNFGMRQAKTNYVVSLDCDDLIEPTWLEYCWWMLEKNPDAAWAYTDSVGFQDQEYLWDAPFDPIRLKTYNHLTEVAMIRKEWFDKVNGYAEVSKHYNEDWHFWLRTVAKGGFPVQAKGGDYLSWYRRTDSGVLSIVNDHKSEWAKKNAQLIADVAKDVIDPKQAVMYPRNSSNFDAPKLSDWNRYIFGSHEKIHLTLLVPWLEMGGADKFNLDLISGLDKEKFEVSILTTVPGYQAWGQVFRHEIPEVFNLPNFVEPGDFAEFVSYFIKSRETDILMVTNSYHGYYMIPWLRQNFPKLAIIDYVHMEEWYWRKGGYARTSGVMGALTEKTYVCNSATEKVMVEHFHRVPETVETLHIGVDSDQFNAERIAKGIVRKQLGISDNRPIVLFICRLHGQKRPFLMLEIAQKVHKRLPKAAFVVVGDGPLEEDLKRKSLAMGLESIVYFAGATKETRPYYRDADVTLICSLKEGLSLTSYESLSMGVPVVSADVGGQCDLVDSSVGALIPCMQSEVDDFGANNFEAEEVSAYADALVKILSDSALREKMSQTGRKKIDEGFSIRRMVEKFQKEFEWLVSDPGLAERRMKAAEALSELDLLAGDMITMELQEQACESGFNPYAYTKYGSNTGFSHCSSSPAGTGKVDLTSIYERLEHHDKVLIAHGELLGRHEQIPSEPHETEEVQVLKQRIYDLEHSHSYRFGYIFMYIPAKIKRWLKNRG